MPHTPDDRWPVVGKRDEELLEEIFRLLTTRVSGDPYAEDGSFAASLAQLPRGLRAMAATHWLDVSLTLDSITWHFGNFGEPGLVAETEAGLRELGLHDLAACFCEAKELMIPLLAQRTEADGDPCEMLRKMGLSARGDELDRKASAMEDADPGKSFIHKAWIRYAREHPEFVFAGHEVAGSGEE